MRVCVVGISTILAILAVAVLASRVWDILGPHGAYSNTTGGEWTSIHNVSVVASGGAAFHDPRQFPFRVSIYNCLFYYFYSIPQVAGVVADGDTILATRLWTLVFVPLMALAIYGYAAFGQPVRYPFWLVIPVVVLLSVSPFYGWWLVTCRPDYGAATMTTLGLVLVLVLDRRGRPDTAAVLGGLCLYAGWAFKQSVMFNMAGIVLAGLVSGRWRLVGLLCGTFFVLTAVTVAYLGPAYRFSIFTLPGLTTYSTVQLLMVAGSTLPKAIFPYVLALVGAFALLRDRSVPMFHRLAVPVAAAVGTLGGAFAAGRCGSAGHYYFEGFAAGGLLVIPGAAYLLGVGPVVARTRTRALLTSVALVAGAAHICVDGSRLAYPDWLGHLHLTPLVADRAEYESVSKELRDGPKPAFSEQSFYAFPWFTQRPAFFMDDYAFVNDPLLRSGQLEAGGIEGLIRKRYFARLVLSPRGWFNAVAEENGYRVVPRGDIRTLVIMDRSADGR